MGVLRVQQNGTETGAALGLKDCMSRRDHI